MEKVCRLMHACVCNQVCVCITPLLSFSLRDRAHQWDVPGEAGRAADSRLEGGSAQPAAGGPEERQTKWPADPRGSGHRHRYPGAPQTLPGAAGMSTHSTQSLISFKRFVGVIFHHKILQEPWPLLMMQVFLVCCILQLNSAGFDIGRFPQIRCEMYKWHQKKHLAIKII